MEVPEIAEGIVKIMGAAREPGSWRRSRVSSIESDVADPVGACVGLSACGCRTWSRNCRASASTSFHLTRPSTYNALAPAEVSMVIVEEERKALLVVEMDDQLSLAIGRQGQNCKAPKASRLLGWKIDVKSEHALQQPGNLVYRDLVAWSRA